jgi:hypothetical protein
VEVSVKNNETKRTEMKEITKERSMKRTVLKLRRTLGNLSPAYRHHRRRQQLRRRPYKATELERQISATTRRTFDRTDAVGLKVGI